MSCLFVRLCACVFKFLFVYVAALLYGCSVVCLFLFCLFDCLLLRGVIVSLFVFLFVCVCLCVCALV